jgi:hypothetical protein
MKIISIPILFYVIVSYVVSAHGAPTHLVDEKPIKISSCAPGVTLIDFGRVAFGNIRLTPPATVSGEITVHFGESFRKGRINRKPPGTVRYRKTTIEIKGGQVVVAAPPADKRNTERGSPRHPPAILTPEEWGVVMPFRWVEIEGWPGDLLPEHITRQSAFSATWDDDAAAFESSDKMLNQIWELCRYSIKATTFAGVYVDGDRERIPYEADAYLNQLSHYYTDYDIQMARDTYDHLMKHGTWPSEWAPHMVFMAYADWMHTGDADWIRARYEELKSKTLLNRRDPDGLVKSTPTQQKKDDIIDWPPKERDGYVRTKVNTVVNAFHIRALEMMAEMGNAIGELTDADEFAAMADRSYRLFQQSLFNAKQGLYVDGAETDHVSLHANLFPLAFGLAPQADREKMADWLANRGMKCSVYAAQYLLEGLFENGADQQAIELITAKNDRSWRHMVESGTTITWEAWDQKYKPNQDWNHAWGAAPANLFPRFILGAEPLRAGWSTTRISPKLGTLEFARGKVPTPYGPVEIIWENTSSFKMSLSLPEGMIARVDLPMTGTLEKVYCNGKRVEVLRDSSRWVVVEAVSGNVMFEVK